MIPLSGHNSTVRTPVVTILILGAIAAVWLIVEGAGFNERLIRSICTLGLVPGELTGLAPLGQALPIAPGLECAVDDQLLNWATPVVSMFLHGGCEHLLGNVLFLWVFGSNIEDVMGAPRFALFYLTCGLAAAAAQVAAGPTSPIPMVGASGAISGVMGAYFVLFPRVRVRMLFILVLFYRIIPLPAWLVLLWWLSLQLLIGLPQLGRGGELAGGIAVWAHVGGFLAGVLFVRLFVQPDLVDERRVALVARGLLTETDGAR